MPTSVLYKPSAPRDNNNAPLGSQCMDIEIVDRRRITEAEARPLAELLAKVFTKRGFDERLSLLVNQWRGYDGSAELYPRSILIREDDRVIAHATAAPHTISTSEGDLTVLGLAHVATDPEVRGRKLGQLVVRAVFDLVDHGPYEHALFQTSANVRAFYEKLGAGLVTNRIVNSLGDDPDKNPFTDEVVMRYPAVKHWPEGTIDLRGLGW
jgi:predicted N-acetyltransferase YhbS